MERTLLSIGTFLPLIKKAVESKAVDSVRIRCEQRREITVDIDLHMIAALTAKERPFAEVSLSTRRRSFIFPPQLFEKHRIEALLRHRY